MANNNLQIDRLTSDLNFTNFNDDNEQTNAQTHRLL